MNINSVNNLPSQWKAANEFVETLTRFDLDNHESRIQTLSQHERKVLEIVVKTLVGTNNPLVELRTEENRFNANDFEKIKSKLTLNPKGCFYKISEFVKHYFNSIFGKLFKFIESDSTRKDIKFFQQKQKIYQLKKSFVDFYLKNEKVDSDENPLKKAFDIHKNCSITDYNTYNKIYDFNWIDQMERRNKFYSDEDKLVKS
ncbi:MAG: hypothetical protein Tsb0021_02620 [Chlamydiales bacterium]